MEGPPPYWVQPPAETTPWGDRFPMGKTPVLTQIYICLVSLVTSDGSVVPRVQKRSRAWVHQDALTMAASASITKRASRAWVQPAGQ